MLNFIHDDIVNVFSMILRNLISNLFHFVRIYIFHRVHSYPPPPNHHIIHSLEQQQQATGNKQQAKYKRMT